MKARSLAGGPADAKKEEEEDEKAYYSRAQKVSN